MWENLLGAQKHLGHLKDEVGALGWGALCLYSFSQRSWTAVENTEDTTAGWEEGGCWGR